MNKKRLVRSSALLGAGSLFLLFWMGFRVTMLYWDGYMYLNGARYILKWAGTSLNPFGHPAVAYLYSRLLVLTSAFNDYRVEFRLACLFATACSALSLAMGAWWLKSVLKFSWTWLACSAVLFLNGLVFIYATDPIGDFLGMGLGTLGVAAAFKAVKKNSWPWRLTAAFSFALAVPLKYQVWIFALAAMIFEFIGSGAPLKTKAGRALIYPLVGILVAPGVMLFIWHFHPPTRDSIPFLTSTPTEVTIPFLWKTFVLSLSSNTVQQRTPWWNYPALLSTFVGWPAVALAFYGWLCSFKSRSPEIRLNLIWFTLYALAMCVYQLMDRYLIHFLPALVALMGVGLNNLPALPKLRKEAVKCSAAALLLGGLLIQAFPILSSTLGYEKSSPVWLDMGVWFRNNRTPESRLLADAGATSWLNFISQIEPIELSRTPHFHQGTVAWPVKDLLIFRTGDLYLFSPRPGKGTEFIACKVIVDDFPLKKKLPQGLEFSNGTRVHRAAMKGDDIFFATVSKPWECWMVLFDDKKAAFLPDQYTTMTMPAGQRARIKTLRRVELSPTYVSVIPSDT